MYIHRQLSEKILRCFDYFPVLVLVGARQTGKTTLLKHLFSDKGSYVVFDPVSDIQNARKDPYLFLANTSEPLILDEIQFAPEVAAAIKRNVDNDRRPGRFILTGSQNWSVLGKTAESLAGRAVILEMNGFDSIELSNSHKTQTPWLESWLTDPKAFLSADIKPIPQPCTLYESLFRGSLPEATLAPLEFLPAYMSSYRQTYIERDVRILAKLEDYQQFGRFIQLAAALTAQEINFTQLGREIGLSRATVQRWLQILKGTFQWFEIPPWHGNTIKRVSGKNKGYFSDTGLACHCQAITSPSALGGHPILGALFETKVASDIRKQVARLNTPPNIYHWRSHSGAEVDLILERDGQFYPIEIKVKSTPSGNDAKGIEAFRKTYPNLPIAPGLLLCTTPEIYQLTDNVYACPWNPSPANL